LPRARTAPRTRGRSASCTGSDLMATERPRGRVGCGRRCEHRPGLRLTGRCSESIVCRVKRREFNSGSWAIALLALSALTFVSFGATVGFAADPDSGAEPCIGCAECDAGDCDGEDRSPLTSHHHCCSTCCISHTTVALPAAMSSQAPLLAEPILTPAASAVAPQSPATHYRPPRV
jgi:hypothetical protein